MENRVTEPKGRPPLLTTLVATALGAGFLPIAPGTWGTLIAVPLAYGLDRLGDGAFAIATVIVIVGGSLAADEYCRLTGRQDDRRVVIDEVAGYLVTLLLVPRTLPNLAAAFLLFRLFDIWKPPPVRWIDRRVKSGFGVVADDVAAGVYGALCLLLVHHFGLLGGLAP